MGVLSISKMDSDAKLEASAESVDFSQLRGVGEEELSSDSEELEALAVSDLPAKVVRLQRIDNVAIGHKLSQISIFDTASTEPEGKLGFRESLSVTMSSEESLAPELANDDIRREERFAELAASAVHSGLSRLREMQIKFRRPPDYFAEMAKTDAHMTKVKARMLHEKERIESAQKNRNTRDIKKNRKKIRQTQLEREQEKRQRANEEISAIERTRKERVRHKFARGTPAGIEDDDDEFPVDLLDVEEIAMSDLASGKSMNDLKKLSARKSERKGRDSQAQSRSARGRSTRTSVSRQHSSHSRGALPGRTHTGNETSRRGRKVASAIAKPRANEKGKAGSKKRLGKSRRVKSRR